MASMISVGVSFLLFFIVLGFMWLVGVSMLSSLFDVIDRQVPQPESGEDPSWHNTKESLKTNIQLVMLWAIPILTLFAAIKMLANAGGQGRE